VLILVYRVLLTISLVRAIVDNIVVLGRDLFNLIELLIIGISII
jgi:hypothetical protein